MKIPGSSRRGFTLIETLVAFAILAISSIMLFAGMTQSVRANMRTKFYTTAVNSIESRFANLGISEQIKPGLSNGQFSDGTLWTLQTRSYDARSSAYWLEMSVQRNAEENAPKVTLVTLKLMSQASAPQ